jgi:hypothetical protein
LGLLRWEKAGSEARGLSQPAVATGHLLRALLCDETCAASRLLREAGDEAMGLLTSLNSRAHVESMAGIAS